LPVKLTLSRRYLLALAAVSGGWAIVPAFADEEGTCTKSYAGDKQQRDAAHYAEAGPDPRRLCDACNYFEARGRCGNCRIFETLVNPSGTCDSWSAKAS
jgi:hypothetical protein